MKYLQHCRDLFKRKVIRNMIHIFQFDIRVSNILFVFFPYLISKRAQILREKQKKYKTYMIESLREQIVMIFHIRHSHTLVLSVCKTIFTINQIAYIPTRLRRKRYISIPLIRLH